MHWYEVYTLCDLTLDRLCLLYQVQFAWSKSNGDMTTLKNVSWGLGDSVKLTVNVWLLAELPQKQMLVLGSISRLSKFAFIKSCFSQVR